MFSALAAGTWRSKYSADKQLPVTLRDPKARRDLSDTLRAL
jgi:hypothetical protein